jgi:uncharacterized membrane protein YfcA
MLLASLFGVVMGLVLGLTGAGGGILAVPALVLGLGWSMTQAAPVALFAVAVRQRSAPSMDCAMAWCGIARRC